MLTAILHLYSDDTAENSKKATFVIYTRVHYKISDSVAIHTLGEDYTENLLLYMQLYTITVWNSLDFSV